MDQVKFVTSSHISSNFLKAVFHKFYLGPFLNNLTLYGPAICHDQN